jgi:hypothetical protein
VTIVGSTLGTYPTTLAEQVRDAAVPADPAVVGYAMPFKVNEMLIALGVIWINVRGEPGGVHTVPIALVVQPPLVPLPGAILCRSKTMVALGVLKLAKFLIISGPGAIMPGRFLMAPLVSPAKDPVFELPGVSGFAAVLAPVLLKKTPVALMTMLPETEAEPVRV